MQNVCVDVGRFRLYDAKVRLLQSRFLVVVTLYVRVSRSFRRNAMLLAGTGITGAETLSPRAGPCQHHTFLFMRILFPSRRTGPEKIDRAAPVLVCRATDVNDFADSFSNLIDLDFAIQRLSNLVKPNNKQQQLDLYITIRIRIFNVT